MRLAVTFPGQGSQLPGMLDAWQSHPVSAPVIAEASEVFGEDLAAVCRDPVALERTDVVQPAVFACSVAAYRVMSAGGLAPVGFAGHSLGEFAALVASGATAFGPTLGVVRTRGLAMAAAGRERPGGMIALVGASPEQAAAITAEAAQGSVLVVANENSPQQTVVSGSFEALDRVEALARDQRVRATRLAVAGAFHSELMAPAAAEIEKAVRSLAIVAPVAPVVQNRTGEPTSDPAVILDNLVRHVVSPVRWVRTMESLAALGADLFVEPGPGTVLTRLAKRCVPTAEAGAVQTPEEAEAMGAKVREQTEKG